MELSGLRVLTILHKEEVLVRCILNSRFEASFDLIAIGCIVPLDLKPIHFHIDHLVQSLFLVLASSCARCSPTTASSYGSLGGAGGHACHLICPNSRLLVE